MKAVSDFEIELTKADQSRTPFIWLPMVQLASFLSYMSLDWSTPFLLHLYSTSKVPCHLFSLTVRNPLLTLKVTYAYPRVPKISLDPFFCDVPARHIPHFFLTPLPPMNQAYTSYQVEAGRWVQVIKHKPHVGNNWSTTPIITAEKAKTLFPTTVNEVHQEMQYYKVPTPHIPTRNDVVARRRAMLLPMLAQRLSQLLLM